MTAVPVAARPAPRARPAALRRMDLPVGREWLIALLMVLLPIERVLVIDAGGVTVRPVFAIMGLVIIRELAVRDWPWAVSRPAQQLIRGTLLAMTGVLVGLATAVWPNASLGYALWLLVTALFFITMVRTITVRADLDRWARWAVAAATFWSVVVLCQWVLAASVLPGLAYSFLGPIPRVHGLMLEPSGIALYLLPHVFLAHQTGRRRGLALITLALVLSSSRLGLIGLVLGILATGLLHRRRRRRTLALGGVVAAALGVVVSLMVVAGVGGGYTQLVGDALNTKEQSSSAPRLESWQQARSLAGDNMPFGVGPGGYGDAIHERGEDLEIPSGEIKTTNLWLETLTEIGIAGIVALIAWSVLPLARLRRRTDRGVEAGLFLGGCAVLATFPLFQTWERPYLWVWWGMLWAAAVMPAHGRPAVRRLPPMRRLTQRQAGPLRRRVAAVRGLMATEVGQAGIALGGRVAATVASVTLTVVTARALGPSDRGVLVLAILAGFMASLVIRGVTPALAYEMALVHRGGRGSPAALIADAWRTTGLATAALAAPTAVVVVLAGWDVEVALIIATTLVCAAAITVPIGLALAEGRMGRWSVLAAGYPVGGVIGALLALVLGEADLTHVAFGWCLGALIAAVAGIDAFSIDALLSRRRAHSVRRQAVFALKSTGSTLLTTAANRSDLLLLGLLSTTAAVGRYSVAIGASELVWFAGEALATAAYGRIGAGRHDDAVRATWRLCGLAVLVATVQAAVLAYFAHDAMAFVFGEEFRVSGDYLQIMLIGTVLGAPVAPIGNYLSNQLGRPLLTLAVAGVILVVTAGVCVAAIPVWGASGAAVGSTSGYAAGLLAAMTLLIWMSRRGATAPSAPPDAAA